MKKKRLLIVAFCASLFFMIGSKGYRSDSLMEEIVTQTRKTCYQGMVKLYIPSLTYEEPPESLGSYTFALMEQVMPVLRFTRVSQDYGNARESELAYEEIIAKEAQDESYIDAEGNLISNHAETQQTAQDAMKLQEANRVQVNRDKLNDYDYLISNFYRIDRTTTINAQQLNASALLAENMKLDNAIEGPKILLYHTHSQEAYCDSDGTGANSVVAVGDYLTDLLQGQYQISVLHHKGEYDKESRDEAYSRALPEIQQILAEHPSIQVVIDLHRDGVAEGTHLVTTVNGKPTAKIMFFNGLSRTTATGDIAYLKNPYIHNNLALSLQLQIQARELYGDYTRPIYLKGYRYNMHLCPKSILVEVGAQTNTFEEARNAMEPLAYILSKVLL